MDQTNSSMDFLPKRTLARSGGPLYRQLADILREPIAAGTFAVGELPKEAGIAEHFGVSLMRAEIADETVASDLGIASGGAILTVEMLYQSADQRNIEFSVARHPAELFSITYDAPNDLS